ncbi:MAG: NADPH-dependent oxidoreductase [Thermaerobacterales bacterium]
MHDRANRYALLNQDQPPNNILSNIAAHASCRSYRSDPLPPGTLEHLITAAQSASTSSNVQAYSVIAVEDQARKQHLRSLCADQQMITDCPLFLVFCPDIYRLRYASARQGYEFGADFLEMFLVASMDAALAAQNVAVAAESLGLGICMIGAVRNKPRDMIDALNLPPGVFALAGMCLGYPSAELKVKARLPQRTILHREQYSDTHLEDGIAEYDRIMAQGPVYRDRQVSTASGVDNSNQYGWAEHTSRRLAKPDPGDPSPRLREDLRRVLEDHGWSFQ